MRRFLALFCNGCAIVLLLSASVLQAADYKPAIEYASMLDMRFYEEGANGKGATFMVDNLQLVFPPAGVEKVDFILVNDKNKIVARSELRVEKWEEFPVFDGLRAVGAGFVELKEPGKYSMAFRIGKEFVTTYQFTLNLYEGGDAMNPVRKWYRDGFWPGTAYFSQVTGEPDGPLKFNWWTSQREVPGGSKGAKCTLHLMRGETEIADGGSAVIISSNNWQAFSTDLMQTRDGARNYFTMADLARQDGELRMVMKVDGEPAKSFVVRVKQGKVVHLPFSELGYEPSYSFMSPKRIDTSSRSGSSYRMLDLWWVTQK